MGNTPHTTLAYSTDSWQTPQDWPSLWAGLEEFVRRQYCMPWWYEGYGGAGRSQSKPEQALGLDAQENLSCICQAWSPVTKREATSSFFSFYLSQKQQPLLPLRHLIQKMGIFFLNIWPRSWPDRPRNPTPTLWPDCSQPDNFRFFLQKSPQDFFQVIFTVVMLSFPSKNAAHVWWWPLLLPPVTGREVTLLHPNSPFPPPLNLDLLNWEIQLERSKKYF